MSGEVDLSAASGLVRKRYDKKLKDLRSVAAVIQNRIEFDSAEKLGDTYQVGVMVRPPNGVTYNGSAGGAATLNTQQNSVSKQAAVSGYELNLVERITLKALASAVEKGEQAIGNLLDEVIAGLKKSAMNRVEASALCGQYGYGTVESVTDLTGNVAEIVITAATWRPGVFWFFGESSRWDSFTTTTKNNGSGDLVLTKINARQRTITVTFTGTLASEVTAGDVLFPKGANAGSSTFNECPGLIAQARNLTATSMGIDANTYNNWKGNQFIVSGEFSLGVAEEFFADLRDRGAVGKLSLYLNNRAYSRLATEVMAARMMDQSYSPEKAKLGQRAIAYQTADLDEVEIVKHPFLAWGEGLILPDEDCGRYGSSDVTLGIPGMKEDLFVLVPGTNTVEVQVYSDQGPLLKRPNFSGHITGITY